MKKQMNLNDCYGVFRNELDGGTISRIYFCDIEDFVLRVIQKYFDSEINSVSPEQVVEAINFVIFDKKPEDPIVKESFTNWLTKQKQLGRTLHIEDVVTKFTAILDAL